VALYQVLRGCAYPFAAAWFVDAAYGENSSNLAVAARVDTPARSPSRPIPADGEPFAHGPHGVAVPAKLHAAAAGKVDKFEGARPWAVQPSAVVLNAATVISDDIN
jgi:hypothetical protein